MIVLVGVWLRERERGERERRFKRERDKRLDSPLALHNQQIQLDI